MRLTKDTRSFEAQAEGRLLSGGNGNGIEVHIGRSSATFDLGEMGGRTQRQTAARSELPHPSDQSCSPAGRES